MLHAPPESDPSPTPAQPTRRRRRLSPQPRFFVLTGALIGLIALAIWNAHRPLPQLQKAPELTPARKQLIVAALQPGWPQTRPTLNGSNGLEKADDILLNGLAEARAQDGQPVWGIAYAWLGPKGPEGERTVQPGFAIVTAGDHPSVIYQAPSAGGWEGPKQATFEDADTVTSWAEAVDLGKDGVGFLQHTTVEASTGGHQTQGRARLYTRGLGGWILAWEGTTEDREASGDEADSDRTAEVQIKDVDGEGRAAVLVTPSWYRKDLDRSDHGLNFHATGPGQLIYRRSGDSYTLSGILAAGSGQYDIRPAQPLYALRAPHPLAIDGDFAKWDAYEPVALSGITFEDPTLLRYKQRERRGLEDASGNIQLLWDPQNLYLHARVMDDHVVPGGAGKDLYRGDHVAIWLDRDLEGDFDDEVRSADDWQIGFSPGHPATAFCWVPQPGVHGIQVASRPYRDTYNGALRGYELEAAIPWANIGGLPTGTAPGKLAPPLLPMSGAAPRAYQLRLAGVCGASLVLSDADDAPQELVYVSNPRFVWSQPTSFNTLLLVEAMPAATR